MMQRLCCFTQMGRTERMKVFGYEAEFKDSVYIDYVLLKDKKKKKGFHHSV